MRAHARYELACGSGARSPTAEPSRPYPIDGGDFASKAMWLYALLGKTLEDPWLHARSRGTMVYNNNKTVPCSAPATP